MSTPLVNSGSISSTGIGSGLDVAGLITKMMAVESRPLTALKTQASTLGNQLSTVGKLQAYFAALQTQSNALTSAALWTATTATSTDPAAVSVSTSNDAVTGSHAVVVSRLAAGQTLSSTAFTNSAFGAGSLTIELGSYGSGTPAAGFSAKAGSSPVTINLASTSLSGLRDQINAAGAGVTASIVSDAAGARLSLRSKDSGAENAFRIIASEDIDDGDPATGLSALTFDASMVGSPMLRTTSAANAELSVDGIALSSPSNTLNNVVDGLSLNLRKTTTSEVTVTVASDTASVKTAITGFVSAFNTLAGFIASQTAYSAGSKSGGALQGDQATLALQRQLRQVINEGSSASSSWSRLSDIGITMQADGTLAADNAKLDNAAAHLTELSKLLITDGSGSADSGFARRFKRLADAALSSDGMFATRTASIQAWTTRNSKSQEAMQKRLDQTQARLQAQYSALDSQMANLNALSTYMTQQITQSNKSTL